MSWPTALDPLMESTVTVKSVSGFSTDGYFRETLGSATTYQAHIAGSMQNVRTFQGTEELANTVLWLKTTSTFSASDQVTLPDGSTPPLLRAESYHDPDGFHHAKLYLG